MGNSFMKMWLSGQPKTPVRTELDWQNRNLQETKDGDYAGAPKDQPMTDEELEAYHKWYHDKKKRKG